MIGERDLTSNNSRGVGDMKMNESKGVFEYIMCVETMVTL